MSVYSHGARLSAQDVTDLGIASGRLAAVADQIKRANPGWAAPVVQLLIEANDVIVRIQNKGAAAFSRYLEKHGLQKPQDASQESPAGEIAPEAPNAIRDEDGD